MLNVSIAEGEEFSANVRMREVENLKEAGSRAAGLRILIGKKTGASYTSDLSEEGIQHMVKSSIELADITTEDPHAGLPDVDELGSLQGDLGLYSADIEGLETALKITTAKRAEEAALSADPRISNSEGASFDTHVGRHIFANSRGFAGEYRSSYCSLSTVPVVPRKASRWNATIGTPWLAEVQRAGNLRKKLGRIAAERYLCAAALERGQGGNAEGPGGLRATHRPFAVGQYLRGGAWDVGLTGTNRSWRESWGRRSPPMS